MDLSWEWIRVLNVVCDTQFKWNEKNMIVIFSYKFKVSFTLLFIYDIKIYLLQYIYSNTLKFRLTHIGKKKRKKTGKNRGKREINEKEVFYF